MGNRIPDEIVDQVQKSADIVEVIGDYVQLKKQSTKLLWTLSFSWRKHTFVFRIARQTDFSLLWLRSGRQCFLFFKADGRLLICRVGFSPC